MLIAWEMGLGKTVLGIAIAEERLSKDVGCVLIICGSSLKYQWAASLVKFTDIPAQEITKDRRKRKLILPDTDYAVIIDGMPEKREEQYKQILANKPDYIILSYDNIINDWKWVRKIKPEMIIADEITEIKSPKAIRTRKLKALKSVKYRYGLTGTPVENGKPEELFSIMQWIDDTVLGRFDLFDEAYIERNDSGWVEGYKNLDLLHNRLSRVMVRRTRQQPEVSKYLPDTEETTHFIDLDSKTAKLYNKIAEHIETDLAKLMNFDDFSLEAHYRGESTMDSAVGRIMAKLQCLEMLCDHPELIRISARKYEAGGEGSQYAYNLVKSGELDSITTSPKLKAHIERLREALDFEKSNKIIVFSYSPDMLKIIANEVSEYGHVFFTGKLSAKARAEAKAKFETDPDCRIFFSSDAGGFGVDLFMANYLFNYDLPDSSGALDQRNARHVRASSKFDNVFIINEVIRGSVEERNLFRIQQKRLLANSIMDDPGDGILTNNRDLLLGEWLKTHSV